MGKSCDSTKVSGFLFPPPQPQQASLAVIPAQTKFLYWVIGWVIAGFQRYHLPSGQTDNQLSLDVRILFVPVSSRLSSLSNPKPVSVDVSRLLPKNDSSFPHFCCQPLPYLSLRPNEFPDFAQLRD